MQRRSPVFKSIAYSCVIVPGAPDVSIPYLFFSLSSSPVDAPKVAFYAGISLRGTRPIPSDSQGETLVPATLQQPDQGIIPYVLNHATRT